MKNLRKHYTKCSECDKIEMIFIGNKERGGDRYVRTFKMAQYTSKKRESRCC